MALVEAVHGSLMYTCGFITNRFSSFVPGSISKEGFVHEVQKANNVTANRL
jgi:hypothetical protein